MKKLLVCLMALLLLCGCASKIPLEKPESAMDGAPLAPPDLPEEEPQDPAVEETDAPRKEPCNLTVANGSQSVAAMGGGYSWWYDNGDGTQGNIEADSMHPLDTKDHTPVLVMDGTETQLLFGAEEPDTVSVRGWSVKHWGNWDAEAEEIPVDGLTFQLKNEGYIYEVTATWSRFSNWGGTARYTFCAAPLGITLHAEAVTDVGMTLVCTQSGGNPSGELQTGSPFWLEWKAENGQWTGNIPVDVEGEIVWTEEAWLIPQEETVRWEVSWESLYGSLPDGTYRLRKEITDFRGTGDYDTYRLYTDSFTIAWVEE